MGEGVDVGVGEISVGIVDGVLVGVGEGVGFEEGFAVFWTTNSDTANIAINVIAIRTNFLYFLRTCIQFKTKEDSIFISVAVELRSFSRDVDLKFTKINLLNQRCH